MLAQRRGVVVYALHLVEGLGLGFGFGFGLELGLALGLGLGLGLAAVLPAGGRGGGCGGGVARARCAVQRVVEAAHPLVVEKREGAVIVGAAQRIVRSEQPRQVAW